MTSSMTSSEHGTILAEVPAGATALTPQEQQDLAQHEAIIARGIDTFVEVGLALAAIREGRLYRAAHRTFEEYCRERWELGRQRAYQLIGAAAAAQNVSTIVDTPLPKNESQLRPLTGLPPEEQRSAWKEAVQTAPQGKVTGAHVQAVVERRNPPAPAPAAPEAPAQPKPLPHAPAALPLPPPLPGLAPAPIGASGEQPIDAISIRAAILARLLGAAAARAQRDWDAICKSIMDRGQYPSLSLNDDQLLLAAQQLIESPAVKAAAGMIALGAHFTLESLDGAEMAAVDAVSP